MTSMMRTMTTIFSTDRPDGNTDGGAARHCPSFYKYTR
jgi:hypothetical protein